MAKEMKGRSQNEIKNREAETVKVKTKKILHFDKMVKFLEKVQNQPNV